MTTIERLAELLVPWMPTQRWFAGKDWPVTGLRVLAHAGFEGEPAIDHLVVGVDQHAPNGGTRSTAYQVAVSRHVEPDPRLDHVLIGEVDGHYVYDALHDRTVTGKILESFHDPDDTGPLTFHVVEGAELPHDDMDSLVLTGEQSNTSLAFGDQALLKVFRRLAPGTNPDIEVHTALARTDCTDVAPLLGWIDGSWTDPASGEATLGSLAMMQEFLVTATDGWKLALTSVADLFAERDLHADEVGGDFAGESFRLGQATASVHTALRAVLPTATWGTDELAAAAAAMSGRLDAAVSEVPALAGLADDLRSSYDALASLDRPVPVQRVHGDLHLGQVLRTSVNWKLIDFEGEPEKAVAERVVLDSPLRDVAGMLRSFDYVALHTLLAEHADDTQLAYRAGEWAERNRTAYLDGYAHGSDVDPATMAVLLRAYETDKAVYELLYEAHNRPSWTVIPLTALDRLAQG
ncbi:MAG: aminoglycoside phosphotransferase [Jiangellales bacterium]